MSDSIRRKLTTILSADVHGYSRLMDKDEVDTLERLKAYRGAMTGFIERHSGKVVNTAGDSLLADFGSVVEAVQCAAEIQRELGARNATLGKNQRMEFRIGINLGDVIIEGDDLYGEGVNIAARLQGLADPGGILISGTVFDQVRNKLSLGYNFIGKKSVKNISEQVPVYRIDLKIAGLESKAKGTAPSTEDFSLIKATLADAGAIDTNEGKTARSVYLLYFAGLIFGPAILTEYHSSHKAWVEALFGIFFSRRQRR